jgi:soluble lytic murein transglycosylase
VYAFLGLERLREVAPEARRALVTKLRAGLKPAGAPGGGSAGQQNTVWQFKPRPVFGTAEWRRAVELARLGFGSDARRELARLGFSAPESRDAARKAGDPDDEREDVYWITSVLLDKGRSWAAAHAIPRYTLTAYRQQYPSSGREAAMWRLAFPRAFPEFVVTQSKANRVPEALQWAIMREESAFNPRIESIANALGLTQMLVKTARRFSERSVSRETLLDPGKNVELGSKYLSFLLDRYGGMPPLTIASYNAGEGAVDRWLREHGELQTDEFLETIDYDETRNYTKRVLSSFLTYAWLYGADRPVPELRFSLKPTRNDHVGRPAGRSPKSRRPR